MKYLLFLAIIIAGLSCHRQESVSYEFPFQNPAISDSLRVEDLISRMTVDEKIEFLMYSSPAIERLGIKAFSWGGEAMHGIARKGRATVFPHSIALAATFDDDLMLQVADAISNEAYAKKMAVEKLNGNIKQIGLAYFSPNINIFRDPRWGRGQETYGEDPYLTSKMGVAFVRGLQGSHPEYLKLAACAKHFFAHSGPEKERGLVDPNLSLKDINETYLPAFRALVNEADVQTFMLAYNFIKGIPCAASPYVIQDMLRDQLGFKGLVMSDGGALAWIHGIQKYTTNMEETSVKCLNAGLDMNLGREFTSLKNAFQNGLITEDQINRALYKGLYIRFRLGAFDPPSMIPFYKTSIEKLNCKEHKILARESARKSIVLLKNNNALPLNKKIKRLYIVGNNATNIDALLGNYAGLSNDMPTILSSIIGAVDPGTVAEYRPGVTLDTPSKVSADWTDVAHHFDAIIAVMGVNNLIEGEEGESIGSSTMGDRLDLKLPSNQLEYFKKLRSYGDKPIILILTGGSPIIDPELYEMADAVLFSWYAGEQGGPALADIIFGDVSPSGKLPITFPRSVEDLPAFADYSMKGRTYRYMEKEPLFPFGYGLTYGKCEIQSLQLLNKNIKDESDSLQVELTLHNNGNFDTDEVVQFYVKSKNPEENDPLLSLKGFKRIHIKKMSVTTLRYSIAAKDLKMVDENGNFNFRKGLYSIIASLSLPVKRSIDLGISTPKEQEFNIE